MFFVQPLISALSGPFRYSGRAERTEIWALTMMQFMIWLGLVGPFYFDFLQAAAARDAEMLITLLGGSVSSPIFWGALGIIFGYMGLCRLALEVRRLHDMNMSGFWVLAPVLLVLLPISFASIATGEVSFAPDMSRETRDILIKISVVASLAGYFGATTTRLFIFWKTLFCKGDEGDNFYGPPV